MIPKLQFSNTKTWKDRKTSIIPNDDRKILLQEYPEKIRLGKLGESLLYETMRPYRSRIIDEIPRQKCIIELDRPAISATAGFYTENLCSQIGPNCLFVVVKRNEKDNSVTIKVVITLDDNTRRYTKAELRTNKDREFAAEIGIDPEGEIVKAMEIKHPGTGEFYITLNLTLTALEFRLAKTMEIYLTDASRFESLDMCFMSRFVGIFWHCRQSLGIDTEDEEPWLPLFASAFPKGVLRYYQIKGKPRPLGREVSQNLRQKRRLCHT